MKRKVRDIYGNWTWQSDEEFDSNRTDLKKKNEDESKVYELSPITLDWRDYVALFVASLETFLLPMVIFVLVIVGIVAILDLLR